MEKIPRLSPEQRTNLVAYLDGELPESEAKGIEQVLSKSPPVQRDVAMLSRTWELLDQLPRLAGTTELVTRTMTTVRADEAPRGLLPQAWLDRLPKDPVRKGGILLIWAAGLALSAAVGFAITNRLVPNDTTDLLRNLPVIQKLDLYSNVGSIEFLKELQKRVGTLDEPQNAKP
jgi:anti-sigma factor RsiW